MEQTFAAKTKQPQERLMDSLPELLCHADDFCQSFDQHGKKNNLLVGKYIGREIEF